MAQEESLKLHRFRQQKRKRLFPDTCSAAWLQPLKSLGTASLAPPEYLLVFIVRENSSWYGKEITHAKAFYCCCNISEVLLEPCDFFASGKTLCLSEDRCARVCFNMDTEYFGAWGLCIMWPTVISCVALAWTDTDPACGWSEGNTAASWAVCGSSAWWRQVVLGMCLPHCCREATCCDALVVRKWLPFTPNYPHPG